MDRRRHLVRADRQVAKTHDVRRVQQPFHMFVHSKHGRSLVGRVAPDTLKHAESVLHARTQKGTTPSLAGLSESSIQM